MLIDLLKAGLPLFFASPSIVGDGGGAGDVADVGGGGGGAETGGVDGAAAEDAGTEEIDTADEPADGLADDDESLDGSEGSDADTGINRSLNDKQIKQALAKLREVDPKAADAARKAWYEAQDFKRVVGSVRQAREMADTLESFGGVEGIGKLKTEAQDYATELTKMAQGDTSIVDELATDYPDGLKKLAPYALSKMESIDPEGYAHLSGGIVSKMLGEKGVTHSVTRLLELIGDGKQEQALKLADDLRNWIRSVDGLAKTQPQQKNGESAEARQLREQRETFDRQQTQAFQAEVGKQVIGAMDAAIKRQLAPYLKSKKLSAEQTSDLIGAIRGHISKGFEVNGGYQSRMKVMLPERDAAKILRYVNGQLDGKTVARSVKAVWHLRGHGSTVPRGTSGTAAAATSTQLGQKPDPAQIDWSQDPGRKRWIGDGHIGEATLKGGKKVRWRW